MKLSPAALGIAAAVALSIQQATALSAARDGTHTDTTDTTTTTQPATCETGPLALTISEADGKASFKCSAKLPVLEPQFASEAQLVIHDGRNMKLSEIIPGATLQQDTSPTKPKTTASQTNSETTEQTTYTLHVPVLPDVEKVVGFKCTSMEEDPSTAKTESEAKNTSCEITITVASSGMSAAFRPVAAAVSVCPVYNLTYHSSLGEGLILPGSSAHTLFRMKLSPATLGVAAAVALSLQQSTALSTARDGSTTPTTPSTEPPVCEKDPLTLTISEVDGKAAFSCSTKLPVLRPEFVENEPLVHFDGHDVKLSEVIPSAKLEITVHKDSKSGGGSGSGGLAGEVKRYTLSVPVLPAVEKVLRFRCESGQDKSPSEKSNPEDVPASCEITITVASSAASAVAGLLSMTLSSALQLFA
ncbi:hypothetical protein BESB_081650 [Besnoitia besnoiti]|uniref:SRS domain-containing protein n=1 Tax=Besnoitia besnoiti TaxID=94643 RepID=A0A2A9MAJ9_BESBE|nr:hypothetical protein BESB_081650 [Besnoitia besnoiti]PFH32966.1 hypothetical protein BESB_081650 [Besnoitia besnoiti]